MAIISPLIVPSVHRFSDRVQGFGPYARVLDGLDYVSNGVGLLPHPHVTRWIERQATQLRTQMIGS